VSQEGNREGIWIGTKEIKLSLLAKDIFVYIENSKKLQKKKSPRTSEFSKVAGLKTNI